MIERILNLALEHWAFLSLILVAAYLAKNHFNHGLNKYPGPFIASLSDWWRFFDVLGRRPDITHQHLHSKHGDIIRLGPNCLSFASPKAIKQIYALNAGFVKSSFYPVQQAVTGGKRLASLFSTTDEAYHAKLRRSVNSAFSMSAMVQYEPFVDETMEVFLQKTDQFFASQGLACDFTEWLQFFAFDAIGQMTYNKRHGFIDGNKDVDNMVSLLGKIFSYVAPIGQMPWLDLILQKNPIIRLLDYLGFNMFASPVARFAKANMQERVAEVAANEKAGVNEFEGRRADLLSMFLKAKAADPEFFGDGRVLTMSVSMAFAGSDTTGISLASVFYYLLKTRACLSRLMEELKNAVADGTVVDRPSKHISWAESQTLPYLDACIKESFRMHPAVGLPLERITPPQGIEICGEHIPGNTVVGCSAWVIHRRPEIFGDDAYMYRPERWLEADKDQLKEMNANMFQFGAGARTCIGKNISLLEIYKLVPTFLRRYDVELADQSKDWKLHNAWFVKQKGFNVRFTAKEAS